MVTRITETKTSNHPMPMLEALTPFMGQHLRETINTIQSVGNSKEKKKLIF